MAEVGEDAAFMREVVPVLQALARLSEVSDRLEMLQKVVKYREALHMLQQAPSFENIARQRAALVEQVSQNSSRLVTCADRESAATSVTFQSGEVTSSP